MLCCVVLCVVFVVMLRGRLLTLEVSPVGRQIAVLCVKESTEAHTVRPIGCEVGGFVGELLELQDVVDLPQQQHLRIRLLLLLLLFSRGEDELFLGFGGR